MILGALVGQNANYEHDQVWFHDKLHVYISGYNKEKYLSRLRGRGGLGSPLVS